MQRERSRGCTAYRAYFRPPKAELPINLSLCNLSAALPPSTFISLTRSFPAVHCKVVKLTGSSSSCPSPSFLAHLPFSIYRFAIRFFAFVWHNFFIRSRHGAAIASSSSRDRGRGRGSSLLHSHSHLLHTFGLTA